MAILGLLPKTATVTGERALPRARLLGLSENARCSRSAGERIAMVFQDALAALNPVFTVGNQIAEAITVHDDVPKQRARTSGSSSCSTSSASRTRPSGPTSTRTSSRAACASGR